MRELIIRDPDPTVRQGVPSQVAVDRCKELATLHQVNYTIWISLQPTPVHGECPWILCFRPKAWGEPTARRTWIHEADVRPEGPKKEKTV